MPISRPIRALVVAGLLVTPAISSAISTLPNATIHAGPVGSRTRFGWPLEGRPVVLRRFERPPSPYAAGHRGVDLAGRAGQAVLAAGDGVVAFAGQVAGRPVASLDHAGNLRTTYEPVRPRVAVGQRVRRGEVVGVLEAGHPECPQRGPPTPGVETACLHWGLRRGEEYLDPLRMVVRTSVRLLPWVAQRP